MKLYAHLLIALALLSISAASQTPKAVPELESLKSSWLKAREQALQPIDSKYETALKILKNRLTKSGNLEAALLVDGELRALLPSPEKHFGDCYGKPFRWVAPGLTSAFTLSPEGVCTLNGAQGTWSDKGGLTIEVILGDLKIRHDLRFSADLKSFKGVVTSGINKGVRFEGKRER
jgi:hypothetical protein